MVERRFSRVLNVELEHVFFHNVNFQEIKILKLNKQALESFQKKIHPRLSCMTVTSFGYLQPSQHLLVQSQK